MISTHEVYMKKKVEEVDYLIDAVGQEIRKGDRVAYIHTKFRGGMNVIPARIEMVCINESGQRVKLLKTKDGSGPLGTSWVWPDKVIAIRDQFLPFNKFKIESED
jgi:hypothetical protein